MIAFVNIINTYLEEHSLGILAVFIKTFSSNVINLIFLQTTQLVEK
jgi:hypothetical protein